MIATFKYPNIYEYINIYKNSKEYILEENPKKVKRPRLTFYCYLAVNISLFLGIIVINTFTEVYNLLFELFILFHIPGVIHAYKDNHSLYVVMGKIQMWQVDLTDFHYSFFWNYSNKYI
ncbi:MAG: hypothetical protein ACW98D_00475 [Promethearchaeota archaeon]|jgi:hypothetical protein